MTRNLKFLGLAIAAMLAFGVVAAGAPAAELHSEASTTTLSGEQPAEFSDKFGWDAGSYECRTITYAGTVNSATTSTFTLTPSYAECTATFGVNLTTDVNGCEYVFHTNPNSADIACPEGKRIEVTAPGCVITFGPQTGLNGISYSSPVGKTDLTIKIETTNRQYEEHNKGFFPTCKANTVATSNGTYTGEITLKGSAGGKAVNIWYG